MLHIIHIMKIEEKSCQNEGAFKTIIFKRFKPIVMQFFLFFFSLNFLSLYVGSSQVSKKAHKRM